MAIDFVLIAEGLCCGKAFGGSSKYGGACKGESIATVRVRVTIGVREISRYFALRKAIGDRD